MLPTAGPHSAAGELAFDQYLDQVIVRQDSSGTLPCLASPTLRGTFLAVRALQLLGYGADFDVTKVQTFVSSWYNCSSNLFADGATNAFDTGVRVTGYSTIEATYYALATFDLLNALQPSAWQNTADAILALQDPSGGFACRPGICTTHDAYFAYKTLQLLDNAGSVNVDALASFIDGRQMSDPVRWWEYGAFTNLPTTIGKDADFSDPNLVTSYYAVATLAACGRLGVLNEPALVQFMGLMKNMSSNLYSYEPGTEVAEHVGTAFLLALDPFLTGDGAINYTAAGTTLLARLEVGWFNEGRNAPANHTLSAACEVIWGLAAGGRIGELSTAAKGKLRAFISQYLVSSGTMVGYALTRTASFGELSNLLPAITGAGKLDTMNVNALYSFIKGYYVPVLAYWTADGASALQHDLPARYAPASPDGQFSSGITVTLPALESLGAIGRLNDFLGETHALGYILGNITASQFVNASAPAVSGAFCPQAAFASTCTGDEHVRSYITPQWTLESLEAIAILDPAAPASHFDAASVWQYLSQWYVLGTTQDHFAKPAWINVSPVEWTCRVAHALLQGGMAGYFSPARVNDWVLSNLNASNAREVAWHLKFLGAATGLARAPYNVPALMVLRDNLMTANGGWYHAQGGTWPDIDIVGILARLRLDRQIYLLNPTTPDPMALGGYNTVSVDTTNLFGPEIPASATVTFSALGITISLVKDAANRYSGSYRCPFNYSRLGTSNVTFTATKGGWQASSFTGSAAFAGTLEASVTCGNTPVGNGETANVKGSTVNLAVTMKVKLGATESAAEQLAINASLYMGDALVTNITLAEGAGGTYSGSYHPPIAAPHTYRVVITMQGITLVQFTVALDGSPDALPGGTDPLLLSTGILVSSASCGCVALGAGVVARRRKVPKKGIPPLK